MVHALPTCIISKEYIFFNISFLVTYSLFVTTLISMVLDIPSVFCVCATSFQMWHCRVLLHYTVFKVQRRFKFVNHFTKMVEIMRFELMTPWLQGRCSPNWAIPPFEALVPTYYKTKVLLRNTIVLFKNVGHSKLNSVRTWTWVIPFMELDYL